MHIHLFSTETPTRNDVTHTLTYTHTHTHHSRQGTSFQHFYYYTWPSLYTYIQWMYKVIQIWPGQTMTCLHTISPGHIWTTLYFGQIVIKVLVFCDLTPWRWLFWAETCRRVSWKWMYLHLLEFYSLSHNVFSSSVRRTSHPSSYADRSGRTAQLHQITLMTVFHWPNPSGRLSL
jgi:hypothetical protein